MIGEKLKYYRTINGYTQRDVAYSSGLKPSVIGKIEAHDSDCRISTVVKIANALEVRIEQLITPLTEQEKLRMKEAMRRTQKRKCDHRKKMQKIYKSRCRNRAANGNKRECFG